MIENVIMIVCLLILTIFSLIGVVVGVIIKDQELLIIGCAGSVIGIIGLLFLMSEKETNLTFTPVLPEEYQELKRGDTLIVEAIRDNKIYLMYPVKTE